MIRLLVVIETSNGEMNHFKRFLRDVSATTGSVILFRFKLNGDLVSICHMYIQNCLLDDGIFL